ncbi:M23 family metallopeptidase [Chryseobacterium sp. Ch-15]|uniref:M23 family metallopeptidase n=1 Tax=Chryseobacterium muglaense TaxID=2893752 RepID=A0A9Q3YRY8_9FLAO|nr:M23 family metallopeptidase [Chryseobacterium muglaense]MBD3904165.1 M23 family metallopeptidase [Chryseobacterium muglaense]MCC9033262.1 M23 family metallopeptidase [Chryseobacterium muglaense]MCM2553757.1 M23 family metallopeptidase [Chryseobacterium muglaense]
MKLFKVFFIFSFFCFSFYKAQELPKEEYYQFSYNRNIEYKNDTITINIENPLFSPLRVNIFSSYLKDKKVIDDTIKLVIKENSEVEIKLSAKNLESSQFNFKINQAFGDDSKTIKHNNIALPFPKGKTYNIMQSNKGSFSHDDNYNKYAVDFNMKVGDTITSADDGFVVGVIKDYEYGGNDRKWRNFANYITIYHPQSGLFTQYVHLKKNGSFVKVGDAVKRNQPIGLSGETGFASGEHLHFNVLIPEKGKTLISVPFSFENNISSKSLKKNMKVTNK